MRSKSEEIEYVRRLFPEIDAIEEPKLREQVTEAWIKAWHTSKYSRIEDAVISPQMPQYKLKDHVRGVVKIAVGTVEALEEIHGFQVNKDYVIAGALLHDIDKIIIFEKRGEVYGVAEVLSKFPHGYIGALIAHEIGLPEDIEHLILSHTVKQIIPPKTMEVIIVHYADCADYDALAHTSGKKLLLQKP
ncbi:MAG: HD domain-containing protein [Candidatus Bathyarchaeia archaeon]